MPSSAPDFETFDHTADVGLIARGATLEDVFVNAARGLFHIIAGDARIEPTRRLEVEVTAPDREALLVAWLNELIFHFETTHLVFAAFEIGALTDERLTATIAGLPMDELDEPLEMELKAATYHGLAVRVTDAGWEAEVLFDV